MVPVEHGPPDVVHSIYNVQVKMPLADSDSLSPFSGRRAKHSCL